jgi:hypothetical protein
MFTFTYLDLYFEIDSNNRLRTKLYDKSIISIFPVWTFHLYVATFHWYNIPEDSLKMYNRLIRSGNSMKGISNKGQKKMEIRQTMIDQILHKKLKIEQNQPH